VYCVLLWGLLAFVNANRCCVSMQGLYECPHICFLFLRGGGYPGFYEDDFSSTQKWQSVKSTALNFSLLGNLVFSKIGKYIAGSLFEAISVKI
jgi:hypothetical protein